MLYEQAGASIARVTRSYESYNARVIYENVKALGIIQ